MKSSIVYVATVLSGSALAAIGGGYEHGDHGSSSVAVGSTDLSEVISTEINSPTGASEIVSEGTTRISVTVTSGVTETATGVPGTAIHSDKVSETISSSVVSQTTASVGSTVSSESSASSSAVVSTKTNEAATGSATSTGSSSEVDSTVGLTATVIQTTGLPTLTRTAASISWSSINWTSISMDTQPIPVTSTQTSVSVTILPQSTVTTTDVVETSAVVSSQVISESTISSVTSEKVEVSFTLSTSTSTYTVVVTGATQTRTTTATLMLTSKALSSSTSAECKPKTVYATVSNSRIVGHPTSNPPLTPYKSSSSAIKTLTSAPYTMVNSTQLNSGVGATGVPQYLNGTASATGTGGHTYTSATKVAQPTFTGDAVNLLNHNYALLAELAAALATLFGYGALI